MLAASALRACLSVICMHICRSGLPFSKPEFQTRINFILISNTQTHHTHKHTQARAKAAAERQARALAAGQSRFVDMEAELSEDEDGAAFSEDEDEKGTDGMLVRVCFRQSVRECVCMRVCVIGSCQ